MKVSRREGTSAGRASRRAVAIGSMAVAVGSLFAVGAGAIDAPDDSVLGAGTSAFDTPSSETSSETPSATSEPVIESSPEAIAWLEKAIIAQGAAELASAVRDLHGKFEVVSNEDGRRLEADVIEGYRRDGDDVQYLSVVRDRTQGKTVKKGFDGRAYWVKSGKTGRELGGREDRADRESIDREIDRVEMILRLFFLGNLKSDDAAFDLGPGPSGMPEIPGNTVALRRRHPEEPDAWLYLGRDDARLYRAILLPESSEDPEEPPLRIDFFPKGGEPSRCRKVYRQEERDESLWVPQWLVLYRGAEAQPSTLWFINELKINSGLEREFFRLESN